MTSGSGDANGGRASERPRRIETLAIHAGQETDPLYGAVVPNIVLSSTFAQPEPGKPLRFDYSRSGNPTRESLETCLAALEDGKFAFAFASGSAAATTLLHTLVPGDHVLCGDDVYGGTYRLFARVMGPAGIDTSFVDMRDLDAVAAALRPNTRVVWLETPTNPMLRLADIGAVAGVAHAHGAKFVVDNTFASPALQTPLALGADVVLHSTTKYVNGAVPSPMDCYLVLRGIRTLPLRMRAHVASATELAQRLEREPGVRRVHYPGLESHPQHALARRQMRGGGGIVSLELEGGVPAASAFLRALRYFALAESLGGVESLAEHPAIMTHASIPREVREASGIVDGLLRLSVGLEHLEDLWADLQAGLESARKAAQ
jgi:cystathionine beta-lyase/cystathionine gamma-synthase